MHPDCPHTLRALERAGVRTIFVAQAALKLFHRLVLMLPQPVHQ